MAFIDVMRADGHAVESVCRVLSEQGCQVAARTYRAWKRTQPSARDLADAYLMNAIWDLFHVRDEATGTWRVTPESLYGRRKVTALLRATGHSGVAHCTVARCLRLMGHKGDPSWQAGPDHDPGQRRAPGRGPARSRLHRGRAEPGLGH